MATKVLKDDHVASDDADFIDLDETPSDTIRVTNYGAPDDADFDDIDDVSQPDDGEPMRYNIDGEPDPDGDYDADGYLIDGEDYSDSNDSFKDKALAFLGTPAGKISAGAAAVTALFVVFALLGGLNGGASDGSGNNPSGSMVAQTPRQLSPDEIAARNSDGNATDTASGTARPTLRSRASESNKPSQTKPLAMQTRELRTRESRPDSNSSNNSNNVAQEPAPMPQQGVNNQAAQQPAQPAMQAPVQQPAPQPNVTDTTGGAPTNVGAPDTAGNTPQQGGQNGGNNGNGGNGGTQYPPVTTVYQTPDRK